MDVITTSKDMRVYSLRAKGRGALVGFVPTMGYLHDGHIGLIKAAQSECEIVVVSVFVNPAQFSPGEDFDKYPRDLERDRLIAEKENVDVLFAPSTGQVYKEGCRTHVEVEGVLTESLCGVSRPGHFRGVTTVVAKLFNIVSPDMSYFGQKDAQQAAVIKRMAADLDFPVEIRVMPTVREKDGLAVSSRNIYLSPHERRQALGLYRALMRAEVMVRKGETSSDRIRHEMTEVLKEGEDIKIDYIEIVKADTMKPLAEACDNTLIAVAAFVGETRLIDNIIIGTSGTSTTG